MPELLLSRHDLNDDEVLKDCEAALARAETGGDAAMAAWARSWGRAALTVIRELQDAEALRVEREFGAGEWN